MTIAAARAPGERATPSSRAGAVRLGMPQLALGGLSEPWLLKELGDRHWRLIAEAAGLERPDFRDGDGAPVYPAFCGTSIEGARFDLPEEHDTLLIASDLARVSRTQCVSLHRLTCRGRPVGRMSLSSVFVRRARSGRNRGLSRVSPAVLSRLPVGHDGAPITALASAVRAGTWRSHFGFRPDAVEDLGRQTFHPCPAQDFNGAGFLYFPSFAAFVDRAEWSLFGVSGATVRARDVVYRGNVDVGEAVTVAFVGLRVEAGARVHWCKITSDAGRPLADVFTSRAA